jgi:Domain of unknown function (DUF4178)
VRFTTHNYMSQYNCPNCGNKLSPQLPLAKMTTCDSCATSLFLDDGQVRNLGSSGEFHDSPLLFRLRDQFTLLGLKYEIFGHACFDYGPGCWDEFWTMDERGKGAWISVDEGELILQREWPEAATLDLNKVPKLGDTVKVVWEKFHVVEADEATCIAVRGDFPEVLKVRERYSFVNCLNEHGELLSGEFSDGSSEWYKGVWIDPFDIVVVNGQ